MKRVSEAQKRMYFEEMKSKRERVYNINVFYEILGKIDYKKLKESVKSIINEDENLRSKYHLINGEVTKQENEKELEVIEKEISEAEIRNFIKNYKSVLDIEKGPVVRVSILKVSTIYCILAIEAHHISMDGTSVDILQNKILNRYQGKEELKKVEDQEIEIENDISIKTEEANQYFANENKQGYEALEIREFHEKNIKNSEGFSVEEKISPELLLKVKEYSKSQGVSVYSVLLAGYSLVLNRYSRAKDFVIGIPYSGRTTSVKDKIGMYVNVLPLYVHVDNKEEVSEYVRKISKKVKQLKKYEEISLEKLWVKTGEINNSFNLVNVRRLEGEELSIRLHKECYINQNDKSKYDIGFQMIRHREDDEIVVQIEARKAYYSVDYIKRMYMHFESCLRNLVEGKKRVSEVEMITEEEREYILSHFTRGGEEYKERSIIKQFEDSVKKEPEAVAVVCGERRVSYLELNGMASSLAKELRSRGVGKNRFVGVLLGRDIEMIVAMLAIQKAGGAYCPIDSKYPLDRIDYMLKDSEAICLISEKSLIETVSYSGEYVDAKEFKYEVNAEDIEREEDLEEYFCLIYTSGTTGQPKGAILTKRNVVNFVDDIIKDRALIAGENVAVHASYSFDAHILSTYPALVVGATQHILKEELRLSLMKLHEYFKKHMIIGCFFTTQFAEQYMEEFETSSLRYLETGGEKLKKYKSRNYRFINFYGPTECTVGATSHEVNELESNIPIGKPLQNYNVYIVDSSMNLCPIGVPGELCISGLGVGAGYYKKPELTEKVFVKNPFNSERGYERLYKTGDLAQYCFDGTIRIIGRIDHQIKIRGYRIEIGEIESRMLEIRTIEDVAILAIDDEIRGKYLVGYYVSREAESIEKLREKLQKNLPEYMVPTLFVHMEKFPLTPNGKVDRKALPKPELSGISTVEYVEARSEEEKIVEKLVCELLGVEKVSVLADFFEIGGNSLKGVNLISKLEKQGYTLDISTLFKERTIERIASKVKLSEVIASIKKAEKKSLYRASKSQTGMYLTDKLGDLGNTYNIPLLFEYKGKIDAERLGYALDKVIESNEVFRTKFKYVDGEVYQEIDDSVSYRKNLLELSKDEVVNKVIELNKAFDLEKGPLFRVYLFKISLDHYILYFNIHHIVFDGSSIEPFKKELMNHYFGEEVSTKELQYKDFAEWESNEIGSEHRKIRSNFWQEKLTGNLPALELQTDFPRKKEWDYAGEYINSELSEELIRKLDVYSNKKGVSRYVVLLTALKITLAKYTRQEDIVIGTAVSGRKILYVQDMLGMFVQTLPLRSSPELKKSLGEYVEELHKEVMLILEHQDFSLQEIIEMIGPKIEAGRTPLYDVVFNYVSSPEREERDGIEYGILENLVSNTAKFDVMLAFEEIEKKVNFTLNYKTSLFQRETMERFKEHYIKVLENILVFENQTISEVEMITEKETRIILDKFNRTYVAYEDQYTFIDLFKKNVEKYPGNIALVFKENRYTYAELDKITDYIALQLEKYGVSKDIIVPQCIKRNEYIVIGAIASQKAGGGYIFVEPKHPRDRQEYLIKDVGARVVLIDKEYAGNYLSIECVEAELNFQDLLKEASEWVHTPYSHKTKLDGIFGIITTSGSTGEPKGSMIEQRNFVNFGYYYNELTGTKAGDQVASYASFSFDVSVATNFTPLFIGATVHIIAEEIRLDILAIGRYFNEENITQTFLPTPIGELYMKEIEKSPLVAMAIGGEALKTYIDKGYRVINAYAPSECTVAVIMGDITDKNKDKIPLGNVQPNNKVYIFDESFNLCPVGVPGELYIGGVQVGRGYYKKPEITSERFIEHPKYGRLYKSGDLCKWLENGDIFYYGRIDFQVKVRGYRIELGEIETRLTEVKEVDNGIVLALDDNSNNKYLCGYYESKGEISEKILKEHIGKYLPEYMVPTLFVHMERFPLTPNGKVDRKALPKPEIEMSIKTEYVAPRNAKESTVAKIYAQVLGMEKVGIDDNFYDLGGSSLKAVGLTAKLQSNRFNIAVTDIFKFKTIRELLDNTETQEYDLMDKFTSIKNRIQKSIELSNSDEFKTFLSLANDKYQKSVKNLHGIHYTSSNINSVLLTGATGFLGSHVLNKLLEESDKKVYCIVRGKSDVDAFKRTEITYQQYFGESFEKYKTRVVVFSGNLSDEKLGVVPHNYSILADSVESIIHCAANVGHYGEYDKFYHDNVIPVKRLIELALESIKKDFHYVSTRSVLDALNIEGTKFLAFSEDDNIYSLPESDNVYIQTKLEGERETVRARELGINTSIYRVGNLVFNSQTKKHQKNLEDNGFFHTIKSALNLGCFCEDVSSIEMSCVDYTAKGIMLLFDKKELQNQCFHLYSPQMTSIIECLSNTTEKVNFNKLGIDEFLKILHANFSAKAFEDYINKFMLHIGWLDEYSEKTLIVRQDEKTNIILSNLGFTWYKIQGDDLLGMVDDAFQKRYQLVSKVPIFYTLDETLIRSIGKKMALKNYNINMEIFKEGNRDNKLYVVIEGAVEILQSISGGWIRSVGLYGDSSVLGAFNLFEQKKASYTAEALYETVILEVSAQELKEYAFLNPELLFNILKDEMTKKEQYMKIMALLG